MITITKERLLTIKQWRETYGPGSNVVLPAEEAEELARIALASLEQNVLSGNSPLIPGEVLSAIREVARIRADFDDFDGDRRGIGDCLDEAEQELIVTINKYASQLAAEPIATNDVREQTAVPPIQADVAQAIENLKQKLVECNRYNYCADAVKNVEDACRAVSYSQADNQPASGNQAAESNRGNEWTGNPDIDNAIIMLDRIDTLENCDDDRIEAVKAVLRRLAGNSPVTPDSWISCSERMPVIGELNWRTSFPLLVTCEIGVIPAYYGFVSVNGDRHYGFMESLKYGDDNGNHPQTNEYGLISNVTHWMPLPERRRRLTVANLQLAVKGE
ncbi:TPA: DUF551 domain-containing protein [Escherichia coli]|nr:DUF551 domain-containing protein [Escherichia coli]HAV9549223.1 DUF551 domain-containing protein [Escherichia coli]